MLFSAKPKGYFVEKTDHGFLLARTSGLEAPLTIEEVRECPADNPESLLAAIKELQPKKSSSGYLHAVCGVYGAQRFIRKTTLDLKRVKDPNYFSEILSQQFRVEAEKCVTISLNATDGTDYDLAKAAAQKEVLFAGIPVDEVVTIQNKLLEAGIYPERLEFGSLGGLGALVNYLDFTKTKTPTLVLEIEAETTNSYIVSADGVEATRPIPQGLESMIPVVQKELGLKDEESARKLFYSNTFDFTGMGPNLIKKLLKELQSSIGFYEVQTGQSVGLLITTLLSPKLAWLNQTIATALGVAPLKLDLQPWLDSRQITVADAAKAVLDPRWFGLLGLMANYDNATPAANAVTVEKKD
jgi:Tfp pilus assembly PilM family ATPase